MTLDELKTGHKGIILAVGGAGALRRRLLDIGLVEDTQVECIGRSPGGDPTAFLIRGAVIAIRSEDCADILIQEPEMEVAQWG